MVEKYRLAGFDSIILDPMCDPRWQSQYVYSNPEVFLDVVFSSRRCMLFVDESGTMIGRYGGVMQRLATESRHWGHSAHFLTQRASQLDKTIRDQCSDLSLFCVSRDDAKMLANEFAKDDLKEAHVLKRGEFYHTGRFKECKKLRVF